MVDFRILALRRAITPQQRAKMFLESIVQQQLQVDGVFEGGGALGAAYIGALRALHDSGLWFARIAGNSAGAITASMVAVTAEKNPAKICEAFKVIYKAVQESVKGV